jgi:hypothetical protein
VVEEGVEHNSDETARYDPDQSTDGTPLVFA